MTMLDTARPRCKLWTEQVDCNSLAFSRRYLGGLVAPRKVRVSSWRVWFSHRDPCMNQGSHFEKWQSHSQFRRSAICGWASLTQRAIRPTKQEKSINHLAYSNRSPFHALQLSRRILLWSSIGMPSALAQLSEEECNRAFRFRTWSRQLFLSLPMWFRACALMAVLLFVANSARPWGGATTDGFSGT